MSLWQIAITLTICVIAAIVAGLVVADMILRRRPIQPETQDDYRCSAARWGYLADRRQGGDQ